MLASKPKLAALAFAGMLMAGTAGAQDFTLRFDWGDIALCTSGSPNQVANPTFSVSHVPEGKRFIRFRQTDLDVLSVVRDFGTDCRLD